MCILKVTLISAAALLLFTFSATTSIACETEEFVTVSGSAAYRQRIAMPPEALLTVRVEDVSRADAPSVLLAEARVPFGARQVPIGFSLKIPGRSIDPGGSYSVRATITVNGGLRFTTTRSYPVLTRGAPDTVDLLLEAAQPASPQTGTSAEETVLEAGLKDTNWKLIELDGRKVTMAAQQRHEVHITLAGEGSRLIAFGGCNQLAGGYLQKGNALRFTQMAGTMMACEAPFMELEGRVLKMLGATTGYRIKGRQLILLGGDRVLARFEGVNP